MVTLNDKVATNKQISSDLELLAKRIFKSWFVDFDLVRANLRRVHFEGVAQDIQSLFPSEFCDSQLGKIPKGWRVGEIGQEVECVGGSTPSTSNPEFWDDGDILWTTPRDLSSQESKVMIDTTRKITGYGLEKVTSGLLPINTVLMSSRAPVGYLAIAKEPVAINQGYIGLKCNKEIGPYYFLNWLECNMESIKQHAGGTTFAEISKKSFRPLPVLVPESATLEKFEETAGVLYERIESCVRENVRLRKIRDKLLPRLLSGSISL